jgi:hypothetical protein
MQRRSGGLRADRASANGDRRFRRVRSRPLDEQEHHPLAVAGKAVLGPRGGSHAVRERMFAILAAANEDPNAFRVTTRYVIATGRRRG